MDYERSIDKEHEEEFTIKIESNFCLVLILRTMTVALKKGKVKNILQVSISKAQLIIVRITFLRMMMKCLYKR